MGSEDLGDLFDGMSLFDEPQTHENHAEIAPVESASAGDAPAEQTKADIQTSARDAGTGSDPGEGDLLVPLPTRDGSQRDALEPGAMRTRHGSNGRRSKSSRSRQGTTSSRPVDALPAVPEDAGAAAETETEEEGDKHGAPSDEGEDVQVQIAAAAGNIALVLASGEVPEDTATSSTSSTSSAGDKKAKSHKSKKPKKPKRVSAAVSERAASTAQSSILRDIQAMRRLRERDGQG